MGFCIRLRKLERVLLPLNSEKKNRRNHRTLTFLEREPRAPGHLRRMWIPMRDSLPKDAGGTRRGVHRLTGWVRGG